MRLVYHPFTAFLATCLVLGITLSLWQNVQKIRKSTEQVGVLEQEVSQMASEVSGLEEKVRSATSSATQEAMIRDQLLMQKPGEYVIQLPEFSEVKPAPPSPSPQVSVWHAWRKRLF